MIRLLVILVLLEIIVRLEPANSFLERALKPYENLLWYTENMPIFRDQLLNGPHYDFWFAGSSYVATSLRPDWVQQDVRASGIPDLTFQNYALTGMRNLTDLAELYDRWMFQMDQPQYLVLGVSFANFTTATAQFSVARSSPMESVFIYPDSVDDYVVGSLYSQSALFRYTLLLRNATFIPPEKTFLKSKPLGGYVDDPLEFKNCDPQQWVVSDQPQQPYSTDAFERMDDFIEVVQEWDIPLVVVNIPLTFCGMRRFFISYEEYRSSYVDVVAAHVREKGIPFFELDTQFYNTVPEDKQWRYYEDSTHPNHRGAALMSRWVAEFIVSWLNNGEAGRQE